MSMSLNDSSSESRIPTILRGKDILVPIKIDITYAGARFVDTMCWSLDSKLTPYDFAVKTCIDCNLPPGFQARIALQVAEQVQAFAVIVDTLRSAFLLDDATYAKLNETQTISIGIRHNMIDYSDKFPWDLKSSTVTPELFASITCADLGLPAEMEPAIAHKIREVLFRTMLCWLDDPKGQDPTLTNQNGPTVKTSEVKVNLVYPAQAVEMISNLWKRAKPNSVDEQASIPQPMLPSDRDSNAGIWRSV